MSNRTELEESLTKAAQRASKSIADEIYEKTRFLSKERKQAIEYISFLIKEKANE